ncbi:MAG: hypothetical protein NTY20_03410 [Candidatus Aenigmarchaeota archaeon]|nr:hypothetical protein [Candidatus Aenigmarchaeota archaeon]
MSCTFRNGEECILLKDYVKSEIQYGSACKNENGSYGGELCSFMSLDGRMITATLTEYMEGSHFREKRNNKLAKVNSNGQLFKYDVLICSHGKGFG